MPFGMVSGVGRGIGVLDGVVIVEEEGAVLGGEFEASQSNQWGICCVRSSAVVREPIELSFGVVSGVGPGIHVRNGDPRASRGRAESGVVFPLWFQCVSTVYLLKEK